MLRARESDNLLLLRIQRSIRNQSGRSLHQNLLMRRQTRNLMSQFRKNWIGRYSKLPNL
jgi:hypothetical protein